MTKKQSIGLIMYGLCASLLIGLIAAAFIFLSHELMGLIWHVVPGKFSVGFFYPLVVGIMGGILVGLGRKHFGAVPKTIHELVTEYKSSRKADYDSVQKSFWLAVIVLGFGASLGPEAALLSILFSLCIRLADKMRYLYLNYHEIHQLGFKERFVIYVSPFNYLEIYNPASQHITGRFQRNKKILYSFYWLAGTLSFAFFIKLQNAPSISTRLGLSTISSREMIALVPLFILGLVFSYLLIALKKFIPQLLPADQSHPLVYGLIGGAAIGISGLILPKILFSGQDQLKEIVIDSQLTPLWLLFLLPFAKFILTEICLATGWVGGDIFPLIYSSVAFGFAIAAVFPQIDTLFIVAIIAATATSLTMEIPLLGGLLLLLFFPANLAPFVMVADVLASWVLPKLIKKVQVKEAAI